MTTRRNPRFGRVITDSCRKRVAQVLPPHETEKLEQYLLELRSVGGPVPLQGRRVNWRRVSEGCGIRYEELASANTALRPIFLALAADLAKPGPRKAVGSKLRRSAASRPVESASQPTVVPLSVGRVRIVTSPANDDAASLFSQTLDATMRERGHTAAHLRRVLDRAGEQVELSTLRSWQTGRKSPATADSLRQLGVIEEHYALPTGSLKEGLPHRSRAIKGHAVAGISSVEMRRLAWHLPDDFSERSMVDQETILEWVRTRIIAGSTDYRRFQAAAMKHRYAVKFPGLHDVEPTGEDDQDRGEKDPDLARACRVAPRELAREMGQLLAFKTSTLTAPGYQRRGVWGEETASQKVEHLGLMFGALAAPANGPVRGRGVLLGDLSFGALVFPAVWDWYVQWRERRRASTPPGRSTCLASRSPFQPLRQAGWCRRRSWPSASSRSSDWCPARM